MAFLTMIAPLVALTYPIDKVTDGKAQAFNAWLREYVYNALLQPFHLIIYTVFVSNALQFASTSIIYMIASLWFVMSAEKILRGFFGFNKAGAGTMGALHTLGLASMIGKIASGRPKLGAQKGGSSKETEGDDNIRFHSSTDIKGLVGGEAEGQAQQSYASTAEGGASDIDGTSMDGTEFGNSGAAYSAASYAGQSASATGNAITGASGNGKKQGRFGRLVNYHRHQLRKGGKRAIKGAAKFATRTAFKAGLGTLAGAVAIASGGDLGAAMATYAAASGLGGRLADGAIGLAGNAYTGIPDAIAKERDVFNGNNDASKELKVARQMKDEKNLNYIRDAMMKNNPGYIPSDGEVREELENYRPYFEKNISINDAEKAHRIALDSGITDKDAAVMLAIGQERGITAAVLNKKADREQYEENIKSELRNAGMSEAQAAQGATKEMEFMKKMHGVASNRGVKKMVAASREKQANQNSARQSAAERNSRITGNSSNGSRPVMGSHIIQQSKNEGYVDPNTGIWLPNKH